MSSSSMNCQMSFTFVQTAKKGLVFHHKLSTRMYLITMMKILFDLLDNHCDLIPQLSYYCDSYIIIITLQL